MTLPTGTRTPVSPSTTTSVVPGAAVATTGLPNRIASSTTLGNPSYALGKTTTSAAAISRGTSSRWPRNSQPAVKVIGVRGLFQLIA